MGSGIGEDTDINELNDENNEQTFVESMNDVSIFCLFSVSLLLRLVICLAFYQ